MSTKAAIRDSRIDTRVDTATKELIAKAAGLAKQTVSSFVTEAAREKAELLLARADQTIMPAQQFDAMLAALDDTSVNQVLQAVLDRPSRIDSR